MKNQPGEMMIITAPCWQCKKDMLVSVVGDDNGNMRYGPEGFNSKEIELAEKNGVLLKKAISKTYLTKEFKYAIGKNSVEVFSGAIDENESILKAAKRELQEELGCIAKNWIKLGKMDPFTSVVFSPANLFLAKGLSFTNTAFEGTEIITHIKLPLAKAVQMVMDSKITHGQSCVLILKAWNYLNGSGRA